MTCTECLEKDRELAELRAENTAMRRQVDQAIAMLTNPFAVRPGRARRKRKNYATVHGKLIAAAVAAKGLKISEVGVSIGYAKDYIGRICRGDLVLTRRSALLIGSALGIDLLPYTAIPSRPPTPGEHAEELAIESGAVAEALGLPFPTAGEPRVA